MNRNSKLAKFYMKYAVDSSAFFALCAIVGIALFVSLGLVIKTDITKTYSAVLADGGIKIEEDIEEFTGLLYVYEDRNEKVIKTSADEVKKDEKSTTFILSPEDMEKISDFKNGASVDVAVGSQSLLKQIILKAGKR